MSVAAPLRLESRNVVWGSLISYICFVPLAGVVGAVMAGQWWPVGFLSAALLALLVTPLVIAVIGAPLVGGLSHVFRNLSSRHFHALLALVSGLLTTGLTTAIVWLIVFERASTSPSDVGYALALTALGGVSAYAGWWSALNRQSRSDSRLSRLDRPIEVHA